MYSRFAYAAPAWFIYNPDTRIQLKYKLSQKAIALLRSIQTECLMFLSRGRQGTHHLTLKAELHVEDIVYKLYSYAMSHRCQRLSDQFYRELHEERCAGISSVDAYSHPYSSLCWTATKFLYVIVDEESDSRSRYVHLEEDDFKTRKKKKSR